MTKDKRIRPSRKFVEVVAMLGATSNITLGAQGEAGGRFEVLQWHRLLVTSENEVTAAWSAVLLAEEKARAGGKVRVKRTDKNVINWRLLQRAGGAAS